MKIVYCLIDSSRSGGMERSVCTKANYLADNLGYDVTIITTDRGSKKNFFDFSSKIRFIDLGINYVELENQPFFKGFYYQLRKRRLHKKKLGEVLKTLDADISISTCTHEFTILAQIADTSHKIAEFHFCRPYKNIEYSLLSASFLSRKKALWGEQNKYRYINKYDAFVVLTDEDASRWSDFSNVEVIPNTLSFYPDNYSSCNEKKVIGIGRLSPQKGFHYLIDAWSLVNNKYPDWVLAIYGEGSEYDFLISYIKDKGLEDHISICSPSSDIQSICSSASVYAMTSEYEGFGLALVEAMACGLPCVAFNCPSGPSEIISDEINGFLIPLGDVTLLAEKIVELIEDDKLRKQMGGIARNDITRFLPENIMPKWIRLFERLKSQS